MAANSSPLICAVGYSSAVAATSVDGITWTQRALPVSATWWDMAWNGGVFCVVPNNSTVAATSPDGITWTQRALPVSAVWFVTGSNALLPGTYLAAPIPVLNTGGIGAILTAPTGVAGFGIDMLLTAPIPTVGFGIDMLLTAPSAVAVIGVYIINQAWADGVIAPVGVLTSGTLGSVLTAPTPTMDTGVLVVLTAPAVIVTGALTAAASGTSALTAPVITVASEIRRVEVSLTAPIPTADIEIPGGFVNAAPIPTLTAEVHFFEMALTAPIPVIFMGIDGGAALFAPAPQLFSVVFHPTDTSTPENPYSTPFPGWVINHETNAPSRYDALPANSMCRFNGKTYMACAAGIYETGADNDAGKPIHASITLGQTNFENTKNKRIPYVYVGMRSSGAMQMKVIANNQADRYYALNAIGGAVRGSRATIGKGLEGQYWQFRIDNVAGADFELDSIEFKPVLLTRHGT
jgi:hypothetical protein